MGFSDFGFTHGVFFPTFSPFVSRLLPGTLPPWLGSCSGLFAGRERDERVNSLHVRAPEDEGVDINF